MASREIVKSILHQFPPCIAAFGYGSAIFQQRGVDAAKRTIDLILVVNNSQRWHTDNIEIYGNQNHYAPMMRSAWGKQWIEYLQRMDFGARLYFNPYVTVEILKEQRKGQGARFSEEERENTIVHETTLEERTIKYGVIQVDDFLDDLRHWSKIYVAGRLHKPVMFLDTNNRNLGTLDIDRTAMTIENLNKDKINHPSEGLRISAEIQKARQSNLRSAVHVALLTHNHKRSVPESSIFYTIANLSYRGDIRNSKFLRAEDPLKVDKIVQGSKMGAHVTKQSYERGVPNIPTNLGDKVEAVEDFQSLYIPILKDFESRHSFMQVVSGQDTDEVCYHIDIHKEGMTYLTSCLPSYLLEMMAKKCNISHYQEKESKLHEFLTLAQTFCRERTIIAILPLSLSLLFCEIFASFGFGSMFIEEEISHEIVSDKMSEYPRFLGDSISEIVARTSFQQTLKGLVTAGISRSLRYSFSKLRKGWFPSS